MRNQYIFRETRMRYPNTKNLAMLAAASLIAGCGVETATTAATVAKLQAEQAKQGKANLEKFNAGLDAATKQQEENFKKTEEAGR